MVTVHALWILLMVAAAYLIGMAIGYWVRPDRHKPMAIKKDYADEDVYGDIPSWLKRQAD